MPAIFIDPGPQDPCFGISLDSIVDRLTRRNWRTKAVIRLSDDGPLYVWISRCERGGSGQGKEVFYKVQAEGLERRRRDWEQDFHYLKDASAYANGTDGGQLAKQRVIVSLHTIVGIRREPCQELGASSVTRSGMAGDPLDAKHPRREDRKRIEGHNLGAAK